MYKDKRQNRKYKIYISDWTHWILKNIKKKENVQPDAITSDILQFDHYPTLEEIERKTDWKTGWFYIDQKYLEENGFKYENYVQR